MRILLIADTFPPQRTSGAEQLRDLAREFVRQGNKLSVILPMPDQDCDWKLEEISEFQVLRLKSPRMKETSYFRRTIAEIVMPFSMLHNFKKSPLNGEKWDAVVWYSPSIFLGLLVKFFKTQNNCKSYLIIRDIFPQWALDMGLISRGIPFRFFDCVARYQYSVADAIGVQSKGNLQFFEQWRLRSNCKIEILPNWLGTSQLRHSSIRIKETPLAERKILVYSGNMGVAQDLSIFIELAKELHWRKDLGFLFVGRGTDMVKLHAKCLEYGLSNVVFQDEIQPDEIADLFKQCCVGIVSLAPGHRTHNIPGKFIKYMQCGLPVLARVNAGNDLASIVQDEAVGQVCEGDNLNELINKTEKLLNEIEINSDDLSVRCRNLFVRDYNVTATVKQIINAIRA